MNGHPKDREGLSLSEYMHGHGVNIRHIGLLRSLYLTEVLQAFHPTRNLTLTPAFPNPTLDPTRNPTLNPAYLNPILDPSIKLAPLYLTPNPTFPTLDPTPFPTQDPTDPTFPTVNLDPANLDRDPTFPTLDPAPFHALQSELFREALCRTLKHILRYRLLYICVYT
jgi:hypothetical protein